MSSMEIDMQSHVKIRSKWCVPGGGGRYLRNSWVGMYRWNPGTLNLYQS